MFSRVNLRPLRIGIVSFCVVSLQSQQLSHTSVGVRSDVT